MSNRIQPENVILEIISNVTGTPVAQLKQNDRLADDIGMDSLDILDTGCQMEKALSITIPDIEIESAKTIGDLTQIAVNKLNPVDHE